MPVATIQHVYFQPARRESLESLVDKYSSNPNERAFYEGLRSIGFGNKAALEYIELVKSTRDY